MRFPCQQKSFITGLFQQLLLLFFRELPGSLDKANPRGWWQPRTQPEVLDYSLPPGSFRRALPLKILAGRPGSPNLPIPAV